MTVVYRRLNNLIVVYNFFKKTNNRVKIQILDLNKKLLGEAYLNYECFHGNYRSLNSSIRLAVKHQCNLVIPNKWFYLNEYV